MKIQAGTERATIQQLREIYEEFHPEYPFEFTFMEEEYQALYEAEIKVAVLSNYFAILAILISCLGLFGLAAFTAERRTKEIGIRKILGASAWNIVHMFSRDFTKMVIIAIVIALPVSYLLARRWLESFAYQIPLEWWNFALAAASALLIAWLTIGYQTLMAAKLNPIDNLSQE